MASLMTIKLNKNVGTSWGFRLQGGKDFATPLCIQKVNGGSVAEKAGLQAGDAIVNISGQDALSLRHKEAQDAIVRAGNSFEIVIQRGSQIWRPQVTALPEVKMLPDGIPVATKTSLSASQRAYKPIGSGHNTTAAPFGELVNAQYNSPLNLYSDDSIAETLSAQAEVLGKGVLGVNFMKNDKSYDGRTSDVLRMVQQMDSEPQTETPATPPTHGQNAFGGGAGGDLHPGENICFACQRLIVGVFVRIKNKNLHAECFRCATCGSSLKNVGYYNINDKLYCDIHAKQAARAHPPAPNMEPIIIQPGAAPPSGALTTAQASKTRGPTTIHQPKHFAPAPAPAPAPFKPPVGGVRILPTTYSALNAPTPYKPEPEIPEPVAQEVPQQHPEPVNEPHITPEPQVVPQQAPPQAPHQHSGDEELPTAPSYSPALPAEVEGASQERTPVSAPAPQPYAPAPAPAPVPVVAAPPKPATAPAPAPAPVFRPTASSHGFGAPAGDIDVRAHIPKKGAAPAPMTFAPAPVPAPIPGFGSNTMPKPAPPPHMGAMIGPGGSVRGVLQAPGQRSTPRRGRGVMNQASASRIPVCAICHRQIRGPFVSALGKTWCPDHFICATSTCRKNIIDMGFVEEQGGLYCEVCYENYLAPICGKCDKRIKGDCLNAVGKQFHPECFCCAYCGKVFGSGAFYLEDGLPYCETDWNDLFTTKCVGCNFPIEAGDRWVEALNNNYHSQCFKCSKCNVNLEGQSFFAKGGKPFCKAHAQRGF